MSTVTVRPGDLVILDPAEQRVVQFDWGTENLSATAAVVTSTFTVTVQRRIGTAALTVSNDSILVGSQTTQVRLDATTGALGEQGTVSNTIVTDESPAQTKEVSVRYLIQDR
jgi:hypothetical protein